jgi:hypothetical protein
MISIACAGSQPWFASSRSRAEGAAAATAQQLHERAVLGARPGVVEGDLERGLRARRAGQRVRDPGRELADRAARARERPAEGAVERGEDAARILTGHGEGLGGRALPDHAAGELDLGHDVLDRLGAARRGDEGMAQRRPVAVPAQRDHLQQGLLGVVPRHGGPAHSADMIWAAARPTKVPMNEPIRA